MDDSEQMYPSSGATGISWKASFNYFYFRIKFNVTPKKPTT